MVCGKNYNFSTLIKSTPLPLSSNVISCSFGKSILLVSVSIKSILSLDLKTLEYREKAKTNFPILAQTKTVDDLVTRTKMLFGAKDRAGEFYRKCF